MRSYFYSKYLTTSLYQNNNILGDFFLSCVWYNYYEYDLVAGNITGVSVEGGGGRFLTSPMMKLRVIPLLWEQRSDQ